MSTLPKRKKDKYYIYRYFGIFLLFFSLVVILYTGKPIIESEYRYHTKKFDFDIAIPIDSQFSIIIPKIGANAKVIKDTDPLNPLIYQQALSQGVAHALGSATPDQPGNTFIFAHSAQNWYQANRYNAVFYLLNKLVVGDIIQLYYQDKLYQYQVIDTQIVSSNQLELMSSNTPDKRLTLMTCWPPATTLKRLVITAQIKSE